jgi:hypothetical protein
LKKAAAGHAHALNLYIHLWALATNKCIAPLLGRVNLILMCIKQNFYLMDTRVVGSLSARVIACHTPDKWKNKTESVRDLINSKIHSSDSRAGNN